MRVGGPPPSKGVAEAAYGLPPKGVGGLQKYRTDFFQLKTFETYVA